MSDLYWYEAFYDNPSSYSDPWGLQAHPLPTGPRYRIRVRIGGAIQTRWGVRPIAVLASRIYTLQGGNYVLNALGSNIGIAGTPAFPDLESEIIPIAIRQRAAQAIVRLLDPGRGHGGIPWSRGAYGDGPEGDACHFHLINLNFGGPTGVTPPRYQPERDQLQTSLQNLSNAYLNLGTPADLNNLANRIRQTRIAFNNLWTRHLNDPNIRPHLGLQFHTYESDRPLIAGHPMPGDHAGRRPRIPLTGPLTVIAPVGGTAGGDDRSPIALEIPGNVFMFFFTEQGGRLVLHFRYGGS